LRQGSICALLLGATAAGVAGCEEPSVASGALVSAARSARAAELASAAAAASGVFPLGSLPVLPETAFVAERPSSLCSPTKSSTCNLDMIGYMPAADVNPVERDVPVQMIGWASDDGSAPPIVLLELAGAVQYYSAAIRGTQRPDVAAALKAPALLHSGYDLFVSFRDVDPGRYSVNVVQVTSSGRSLICDTHRKILVR
jgi:hypothetical protein